MTLKTLAASLMALALLSTAAHAETPRYVFGADLSYVNEMEGCGAVYSDAGKRVEPYAFFKSQGVNLVRIRLWNDPDWTKYSNLADVKRSLRKAKAAGLPVLLDFHYSDDWADGDKQVAPKAWKGLSTADQAKALHDFTLATLIELDRDGLMPDMVQVGNETNGEIVSSLAKAKEPIDWTRNALLFNAGIRAVREAGAKSATKPRVMLHIAQPENVEPWFAAASKAGITDFDVIGISYYRKWSTRTVDQLGQTINRLRLEYPVDVMVVETAYPFTTDAADASPNLLGADSLVDGYPATPDGQRRYLVDLTQTVVANGGSGVVYWEPAWLSTRCKTRWGTGSNWENAALFDFKGRALPGASWPKAAIRYPVTVEFRSPAAPGQAQAFIGGDFLAGLPPRAMTRQGETWTYAIRLMPGTEVVAAVAATPDAVLDAEAVTTKIGDKDSRIALPAAGR